MFLDPTTVSTLILAGAAGWLPTGLRWNTGQFPIQYCLTTNGTNTSVSAAGQRSAVEDAINVWVAQNAGGSLSCTTYTVASQSGCGTSVNTSNGRHDIFWEDNWGNGSGTIGVTWSSGSGQSCGSVQDDTGTNHNLGCKFDADIELNDNNFFWTDAGNGGTDIASIAAHEYGHFLGLDHCDSNGTCGFGQAIMFSSYGGGVIRVPFTDDVQGACGLYPGTPGGLGWPCTANNQCTSNICVNPGNNGYCSETCGSCPTGYACEPNPQNAGQMVCVRDDGRNKDSCEPCAVGLPDACINNGLCVRGIPESNAGRCVMPCDAGGGTMCSDTNFQCLAVQDGNGNPLGSFCYPGSSDCNDPGNFTRLQLGQNCSGNPPCDTGLTCIGICAPTCVPGNNDCPQNWGCETFQGGDSFCVPAVDEGQVCEGLVSCSVGPCLRTPGVGSATCFRDCAGDPSVCNNAQTCTTYNLQGGGTVSICEPPGVPPNPPDAGVNPPPDTGVPPGPDTGVPGPDGGVNPGDTGTDPVDSGMSMVTDPCLCDTTYGCDLGCEGCDPECACDCDVTFSCDPNCDHCDPECTGGCSGCATTPLPEQRQTPIVWLGLGASLGLGLILVLGRRRRRR